MKYKKIARFILVCGIYSMYFILSLVFRYRLLMAYTMTIGDLSIFCSFDPYMYVRDVLVFLVLLNIIYPSLKSYRLIRTKRVVYINQYSKCVLFVSLLIVIIPNFMKIIFMLFRYFDMTTLINASYFQGVIFTVIFQYICFILIGHMYTFFLLCVMHKWKAAIITLMVCIGFYALYMIFQCNLLFKDYFPLEDLYDYTGRINSLSVIEWVSHIAKYSVIALLLYFISLSLFSKRDVLYDVT